MSRSLVAIAIGQCVLCFALSGTGAAQTREDEAAIRRSFDAMTKAFNARDDAATLAVATADADFVTVNGNWTKGKDYTASRRKRFSTALKRFPTPVDAKIRFLRSGIALAHVTHELAECSTNRETNCHRIAS